MGFASQVPPPLLPSAAGFEQITFLFSLLIFFLTGYYCSSSEIFKCSARSESFIVATVCCHIFFISSIYKGSPIFSPFKVPALPPSVGFHKSEFPFLSPVLRLLTGVLRSHLSCVNSCHAAVVCHSLLLGVGVEITGIHGPYSSAQVHSRIHRVRLNL